MLLLPESGTAQSDDVREIRFDLELRGVTVKEALRIIEHKSNYTFFYNDRQVDTRRKVDVQVRNESLMHLLSRLLPDCSYTFENNKIFLTPAPRKAPAAVALQTVAGRVVDPQGVPVIGANIAVKGTAGLGAVTDTDGRFMLRVQTGAVLVVSYIGYVTQEVHTGRDAVLKIVLQEDTKKLDEIVVVGYGSQKKLSLTGAISAVRGEELLKAPSTNISSLLGGQLPGISSVQESGEPGLDQASLRIRGSVYNVTYIVDGMPRSINDIDPHDVESISVLKDGASAAVYGLKGAGGVVIVTTRKGREGKSEITYNGSFGASMNANFPKFMNGPQFAHYYNMGDLMDQLANGTVQDRKDYVPVFTGENVRRMLNGDPSDGWDNVDYIDRIFGTGFNQQHSITAQGGTDAMRYFVSAGYLGQQGNIDNFTYKRYNLRTNLEARIASGLTLRLGAAGHAGRRSTPGYASGGTDSDSGLGEQGWLSVSHQTIAMHPYLPEKYQGLYTATLAKNTSLPQSPLAAVYESGYKRTRSVDLQTNLTLQYEIPRIKGLSIELTGAYDYGSSQNKNLDTPYRVYAIKLPDSTSDLSYTLTSDPRGKDYISLGEGQTTSRQLVGQGSLRYGNRFGKHRTDVLFLAEVRDYRIDRFSAYAKNLDFPELPELNLGVGAEQPVRGSSDASRSVGYVFRLKYDYSDKYLAELTGRYDGSYKFAGNIDGRRWAFFPSVSLAWRISQERFMQGMEFLDDLKIRGSVGLLGNDGVTPYSFLSTYAFGDKLALGGKPVNSLYTSVIANPYLSWEKTLSYNAGVDFTLWNGLLGMELDVFYTYTYDMLTSMGSDYPPSMGGYYRTYANYNKVDARGIEVAVNHRHRLTLAGRTFRYGAGANITYARNRFLRYPDSPNIPEWQKVTGKSVYASYGWIAEGLFRSEEEIDRSAWYGNRPNLGDIKYKDLNGDGKIDSQDRGRIGRDNRPQLTFGLNLDAEWNGIDFNARFTGGALFDVSLTGTYYNGYDDNTIWTQTFKEGANSPLFLVENAYSIDNPTGTFPRITIGNLAHGGDNGLASTFWFRDGKYLRLKSVQLGYTLPKAWLVKTGIRRLRFFIDGSNLFTVSGLPDGIDPESPGVNNGYYPQQKTVMGGVSFTF